MPGGEAPAPKRSLLSLSKINVKAPTDVDAVAVGSSWLEQFGQIIEANDVDGAVALFIDDAFWRDMLALTWEFRTFEGTTLIKRFLADRLPISQVSQIKLKPERTAFKQPHPDLVWVEALFSFETEVGLGSGVVHLVPMSSDADPAGAKGWKVHTMYTNLEDLKGFPERIGFNRDDEPHRGTWPERRRRESAFEDSEPSVVVVGAGHSGLDVAARLQLLGVSTLVVERNVRVGDQWRGRYETLCLHDPICEHRDYSKEGNKKFVVDFVLDLGKGMIKCHTSRTSLFDTSSLAIIAESNISLSKLPGILAHIYPSTEGNSDYALAQKLANLTGMMDSLQIGLNHMRIIWISTFGRVLQLRNLNEMKMGKAGQ